MVDVVRLLNVPLPWDGHGSAVKLPERYNAALEFEASTAAMYFVTTGRIAPATDETRVIPGLDIDETGIVYKRCMLHASNMDDIRAAVEFAALSDQPQRLIISGAVKWERLNIKNCRRMILDFSSLWIDVAHCDGPLILLHKSQKVQIRGLKVTQAHDISIDVTNCTDIVISSVALAGIFGAGIRISGGSKRILVDCSIFVNNGGTPVKLLGEVQNVVILQSQFFGPTSTTFIYMSEASVAVGYDSVNADEAGRDALITAQPTNIRIVQNRFGKTDDVAIMAKGCCGIWIENNDFDGEDGGTFCQIKHCVGAMVAGNSITSSPSTKEPLVAIVDTALFCLFHNSFTLTGQLSIHVSGSFGGGVIAWNSIMSKQLAMTWDENGIPVEAQIAEAGIRLDPGTDEHAAFMATTVMLNIVRGAFLAGLKISGIVPRLFLFDNHFFGMIEWSINSEVVQPNVTSLNNWGLQRSLNIPLSEVPISVGRVVWDENRSFDDLPTQSAQPVRSYA